VEAPGPPVGVEGLWLQLAGSAHKGLLDESVQVFLCVIDSCFFSSNFSIKERKNLLLVKKSELAMAYSYCLNSCDLLLPKFFIN
jgi:hypothetical protein